MAIIIEEPVLEGMGPDDIDSLLDQQVSDGDGLDEIANNLSHIDDDDKYMEDINKEGGLVYDTDDSQDSDIPEEHENGYGYNEYMRRYILNIKTLTWNRDSQGLFDYETRYTQKEKLFTEKATRLLRSGNDCKIQALDDNLQKLYGRKGQVLFNVRKVRNHYMIEPAEIERWHHMNEEEKKDFMSKDVD